MRLTKHHRNEAVLITDAQPSLDDQLARRRRRYLITMSTRIVCLVLAALFYQTLWIMAIFALLALALPWIAVVMANDRLPPKAEKINRPPKPDPRSLPARENGSKEIDA